MPRTWRRAKRESQNGLADECEDANGRGEGKKILFDLSLSAGPVTVGGREWKVSRRVGGKKPDEGKVCAYVDVLEDLVEGGGGVQQRGFWRCRGERGKRGGWCMAEQSKSTWLDVSVCDFF